MPLDGHSEKDTARCPQTTMGDNIRCELPAGHNSPHENNENGKLTWEPRYVGDLRRKAEEIDDWKGLVRDLLVDLGDLRSDAIDDARRMLDE